MTSRVRKAVEALLTNAPDDGDQWRERAPVEEGWLLSRDLWKRNVCAQTQTWNVRQALRDFGLTEERRVTKPSPRRGRPDAHTTAIRLRHGEGFRKVLLWLLRDYYLYVKHYREYRAPYFDRNADQLERISQGWRALIQPIDHLLTPEEPEQPAYHREILFAEAFELYLDHPGTAEQFINELATVLRKVCTEAPAPMRRRCRHDFLIRILFKDNILKRASAGQSINKYLEEEVRAFNRCLEEQRTPLSGKRPIDIWL